MSDAFTQVCSAVPSEGRSLRRRRSAASAALLSRPSMLTLGELVPSFETCVLVYACSAPARGDAMDDGEAPEAMQLKYALFEPNFLVESAGQTVRKLDRPSWERLRSHVEELRIVALSSRYSDARSPPNSPVASCAATSASAVRGADCVFDLCTPTDPQAQRTVSQLLLQPKSYASVPARSRDELLEIEIHSPCDAAEAQERRVCLPTQLRAVLNDAEQLLCPPTPLSAPADGQDRRASDGPSPSDFGMICQRILQLVQRPLSAS